MAIFLPSEIGRLVLGYLKEEGCTKTYRQFMNECVHVVEYASHYRKGLEFPTLVGAKTLKQMLNEYGKYVLYKNEIKSDSVDALWLKHDVAIQQIKSLCTPLNAQVQRTSGPSASLSQSRQRCRDGRPTPSSQISGRFGSSSQSNKSPNPEPETSSEGESVRGISPPSSPRSRGSETHKTLDYESDSDALVVETDNGSPCNTPVKKTPVRLSQKPPRASTSGSSQVRTLSPTLFDSCAVDVIKNKVLTPAKEDSEEQEGVGKNTKAAKSVKKRQREENPQRTPRPKRTKRRAIDRKDKSSCKSEGVLSLSRGDDGLSSVDPASPSPPESPSVPNPEGRVPERSTQIEQSQHKSPQKGSKTGTLFTPKKTLDLSKEKVVQLGKSPRRKRPMPQRRSLETPLPSATATFPAEPKTNKEEVLSMPMLDDLINNSKFVDKFADYINRVKNETESTATSQSETAPNDSTESDIASASVSLPDTKPSKPVSKAAGTVNEDSELISSEQIPDAIEENSLGNVLELQENEEAVKRLMELTKNDPEFDALLHMVNTDMNEYLYQDLDKLDNVQTEGECSEIIGTNSVEPVASTSREGQTVLKVKMLHENEPTPSTMQTAKLLIPSSDNGPPVIERIVIQGKVIPTVEALQEEGKKTTGKTKKTRQRGGAGSAPRRQTRSQSKVTKSGVAEDCKTDSDGAESTTSEATTLSDDSVFKVPVVPQPGPTRAAAFTTVAVDGLGLIATTTNDSSEMEAEEKEKKPKRGGVRRSKSKSLTIPKKKKVDNAQSQKSSKDEKLPKVSSGGLGQRREVAIIHQEPTQPGVTAPSRTVISQVVPVSNGQGTVIDLGVVIPPPDMSMVSTVDGTLPCDIINNLSIYTRGDNRTTQPQAVYQETGATQVRTNQMFDAQTIYPSQVQPGSALPQDLQASRMYSNQECNVQTEGQVVPMVTDVVPTVSNTSVMSNPSVPPESMSTGVNVLASAAGNSSGIQDQVTSCQSESVGTQNDLLGSTVLRLDTQSQNSTFSSLPQQLSGNTSDDLNQKYIHPPATTSTESQWLIQNSFPVSGSENGDMQVSQALDANKTMPCDFPGTVNGHANVENHDRSARESHQENAPSPGLVSPTEILQKESDVAAATLENLNKSVTGPSTQSSPFYSNPETPSLGAQEIIASNGPQTLSPYTSMTTSMSSTPDCTTPLRTIKRAKRAHGCARTNFPYAVNKFFRKKRRDQAETPLAKNIPEPQSTETDDSCESRQTINTPEKNLQQGRATPLATMEATAVDTLMALSLTPVKTDPAGSLTLVKTDQAGSLTPVKTEQAGSFTPVKTDQAGSPTPVKTVQAGSITPVKNDIAGSITPVETDHAVCATTAKNDNVVSALTVQTDEAASATPVQIDQADSLKPVSTDQADSLKPVNTDQVDSLKPLQTDQADLVKPVSTDQADSLKPVSTDQADPLKPVNTDQVDSLIPVNTNQADSQKPLQTHQAGSLTPVKNDEAEPVTHPPANPQALRTADENDNDKKTLKNVDTNSGEKGSSNDPQGMKTPTKEVPERTVRGPVSPVRSSLLTKLVEVSASLLKKEDTDDAKTEEHSVKTTEKQKRNDQERKNRKKAKKATLDRMNVERFLAKLHSKH